MSIWTSSAARAAALCLCLGACVPGLPEIATSSSRSVPVLNGALRIQGAPGYCVDRGASRETGAQAVVIMGRCSQRDTGLAAIVTVAVGGPGSASALVQGAPELAAYFSSEAGRAALSRDGDAASVRMRDIRTAEGRLILHLEDAATGETWRALIGLRGRLVSVSISGARADSPLGDAGKALLDRTITALARANPVSG